MTLDITPWSSGSLGFWQKHLFGNKLKQPGELGGTFAHKYQSGKNNKEPWTLLPQKRHFSSVQFKFQQFLGDNIKLGVISALLDSNP